MPQKPSIFEVMGTSGQSDLYTYDSILPGSIRLLKIHSGSGEVCCSIAAISLADAPQYGALSYTWGGPTDDCFIRIDGLRYGVRKNLLRFLKQIRNMDNFWSERNWIYIWIHAICVNQSDAEERTQQVGMFSDIYRRANEVIVWLGPSYGESGRALCALAAACRRGQDPAKAFCRLWWKSEGQELRNIAERPYWTRLWGFQELVLAQKQTLLCGDLAFDWEDLTSLFDNLESHPPQRLRLQSFNYGAVIRSPARDMCTQVQNAHGRSTLFEQIRGTQHLRCNVKGLGPVQKNCHFLPYQMVQWQCRDSTATPWSGTAWTGFTKKTKSQFMDSNKRIPMQYIGYTNNNARHSL